MFLKLKNVLCLLICFSMAFTCFAGCKKKTPQNNSSVVSDTISSDENNQSSEEEITEEASSEETYDDYEDYSDYDDSYDDGYEETPLDVEDAVGEIIEVHNSEPPISTNYRGVSSTVWHCYGFMKDDITGRVYNDEMMDMELGRLVESGVKFCRTRFNTSFVWDTVKGGWNWDSPRFQYFCDYANALDERGINILFNFVWSFAGIVEPNGYSTEVAYLEGEGDLDYYGESSRYDMSKLDVNYRKYARAGLRIGEYTAQFLKAAKQRGVKNISHLLYFTEPSMGNEENPAGKYPAEYLFVCQLIKKTLKDQGLADDYLHMGPNQTCYQADTELVKYVMDRDLDLFDVYSAHNYIISQSTSLINDVYYDLSKPWFELWKGYMTDSGAYAKGKEFWMDEYDSGSQEGISEGPWNGLQNTVVFIGAQQAGIDNVSDWQFADQLWTDDTGTSGEFVDGIHISGSMPSLFNSSLPYEAYYFTNLFRRYHGYQNGTVYKTTNGLHFGVYVGAVQLEDGNWTIAVANVNLDPVNVLVKLDKSINTNLYRHTQTTADMVITEDAKLAGVDKCYKDVKDRFYDELEPGSLTIYTSVKK